MTRILLPLFLLTFVVAPFSGSAQITLESSDLTSIGDQILRYVDTIPAFGPGGDGPNQTWDFSAAVNDTLNNTSVVTVASTPFASTFASSTYSMTNDNSSYLYFTHDANSIETTGAAGDLLNNGDQIESPFSDPLTLHQFPRTYMSTFDDTYAFVTEASGNGLPTPIPVYRVRLTHAGHVYDTTDAYGTLITPTGTYDALRVKSVDYTSDLLEYKLFQFSSWTEFGTTTDTSTTYSWHAKEEMLAIAEFSFDSIGNPKRFVYSTVPPAVTTDVASADEHKGWKVFPQPAQDELFISSDHSVANYLAEIYSVDGRLIAEERLLTNRVSTDGLPSGMYLLRLMNQDGIYEQPIRFLIRR